MGAYELGVIERLFEEPDLDLRYVSGVSIGAITAAVLVGAKSGDPVATLRELWDEFAVISSPLIPDSVEANLAMFGNAAFYRMRSDYFTMPWWTHFYDVEPIRERLADLVDFTAIRDSNIRLVVTATNIRTGPDRRVRQRRAAPTAHHRPYPGERQSAAWLSHDDHRRSGLLGRRSVRQHAAFAAARARSPGRGRTTASVCRQPFPERRTNPGQHARRRRPHRRTHLLQQDEERTSRSHGPSTVSLLWSRRSPSATTSRTCAASATIRRWKNTRSSATSSKSPTRATSRSTPHRTFRAPPSKHASAPATATPTPR